jgi:hypothetical protein
LYNLNIALLAKLIIRFTLLRLNINIINLVVLYVSKALLNYSLAKKINKVCKFALT